MAVQMVILVHVNVSRSATSQNNQWMRDQNIMLCSFDVRGIVIIRIRIKIGANLHLIYWGGFIRLHIQ